MPWQRYWCDVSMEIDDAGLFVYSEDVLSIGRQEGKTGGYRARANWRLAVHARVLGPQLALYIAQRRQDARKRLEREFAGELRKARGFREVTHPRQKPRHWTEWRLQLNNGAENIEFGSGSRLGIDAPSRTGVHGDSVDDAAIDEAWAQPEDIETGVTPTMATRTNAQLHVFSAAGDENSFYWYRKVLAGREACRTGQHGSTAYFEWGADDDADPGDPATWAAACPALGITISHRFMENEWARAQRDGEEAIKKFRRNYLNQWPEVPVLDGSNDPARLFPAGDWTSCRVDDDDEIGMEDPVAYAIDVAPDRSSGSISAAGTSDADDRVLVETIDNRPGTSWIVPRLVELGVTEVALDPAGAAGSLIPDLERAGITVVLAKLRDVAHAIGSIYDDVVNHRLWQLGQPVLDEAVAGGSKRTVGELWLPDRRTSSIDLTPLCSANLALWLHRRREDDESLTIY